MNTWVDRLARVADQFGKSDPRKMPAHLFHGALKLDYDSAQRADTSKQTFTVCPRHWYIDAAFHCVDCGSEFVFSAKEQQFWYEERKFYVDSQPNRCVACRKKERVRKREAQLPKAKRK
jgi:hypothetical protein